MLLVILLIVVVILIITFVVILKKNDSKTINNTMENNNEDVKLNMSDVNMMNNINEHGFTATKVEQSNIPIPDFKPGEKIGYKDLSHIDNTYGNQISNNYNDK